MDGSGIDFILLPAIIVPCLAAWLISIYIADAHPAWKRGGTASQRAIEPRETALQEARPQEAGLLEARPQETGPQEATPGVGQAAVPAQRVVQAEILDDDTTSVG